MVLPQPGRAGQRHLGGRAGSVDEGQVSLYLVVIAVALMAFVGLAVDGGAALAARGRAADLAAEAARAGAEAISEQSLRSGSPQALRVDPVQAQAAAQRLLAAGGATGTLTITGPGEVRVSARVTHPTAIWSVIGVEQVSGSASASAVILHGTATGGR